MYIMYVYRETRHVLIVITRNFFPIQYIIQSLHKKSKSFYICITFNIIYIYLFFFCFFWFSFLINLYPFRIRASLGSQTYIQLLVCSTFRQNKANLEWPRDIRAIFFFFSFLTFTKKIVRLIFFYLFINLKSTKSSRQ